MKATFSIENEQVVMHIEPETIQEAWQQLQEVESYVERQQEDEYYCGLCGFVPIASPCVHLKG